MMTTNKAMSETQSAMTATVTFQMRREDYVPEGEARVGWLSAHGAPPEETQVQITATLAAWHRAGAEILASGAVCMTNYSPKRPSVHEAAWESLWAAAQARLARGEQAPVLDEADVETAALAVAAAREAELARHRQRDAEAAATRAAQIQDLRARGIEAALRRQGQRAWTTSFADDFAVRTTLLQEALGADVYERAQAEADRRNAEVDREHAEYLAAITSLAARYDDLARPAQEGYDVERAVLDRLAKDLVQRALVRFGAKGVLYAEIDAAAWRDPEERAAPRPEAFAVLDAATAAAQEENERMPAALGARWTVSRIVRIDVCPHNGETHWVTAVTVTLSPPASGLLRQVTLSAEDLHCGHGHPTRRTAGEED